MPGEERLDDQFVVIEDPVDGERVEIAPSESEDDEQRGGFIRHRQAPAHRRGDAGEPAFAEGDEAPLAHLAQIRARRPRCGRFPRRRTAGPQRSALPLGRSGSAGC